MEYAVHRPTVSDCKLYSEACDFRNKINVLSRMKRFSAKLIDLYTVYSSRVFNVLFWCHLTSVSIKMPELMGALFILSSTRLMIISERSSRVTTVSTVIWHWTTCVKTAPHAVRKKPHNAPARGTRGSLVAVFTGGCGWNGREGHYASWTQATGCGLSVGAVKFC